MKKSKKTTDDAPKSAVELAMERFARKDAEEGKKEPALSDQKRKAIAEIRQIYEARLAEKEILYQSELGRIADPEARNAFEENYRRERDRMFSERDLKLEAARKEAK